MSRFARRWPTPAASAPFAIVMLVLSGCGGVEGDTRPRQTVSGGVTLDGKPLERGDITFDPLSTVEGVQSSGKIEQGRFAIDRDRGPTPGQYIARISSVDPATMPKPLSALEAQQHVNDPGPKDLIPVKYNVNSTLKADVKASSPNEYTFELTSK